jgi:predicted aspartyl protease
MILDTGATSTLIKKSVWLALGFDLANATDRVTITTGSAQKKALRVVLTRLSALVQYAFGIPMIVFPLHAGTSVPGFLGLGFLRGHVLTIDFLAGQIDLT